MKSALVVVVVGVVAGCGSDPCDPTKQTCTYEADVSTLTVGGGVEDEDTCQSWTLNNPTELWVSEIAETNTGAYHHANWFFVPDDQFKLPDGTWKCDENNFSELVAGLEGGFLFALSTQSTGETQSLPAGSAIRIPPYSRIIGSSHLLNTSDSDITTTMHLEIATVPPSQVQAKLAPARISYHDLTIEPNAHSAFTTECDLAGAYNQTLQKPLAYTLYYVLSHYHALGTYQQLEILGGPRDGEVIMRNDGFATTRAMRSSRRSISPPPARPACASRVATTTRARRRSAGASAIRRCA